MNRKKDSTGLLRKRKYDARKKIRNIDMTNTTLESESASDNDNACSTTHARKILKCYSDLHVVGSDNSNYLIAENNDLQNNRSGNEVLSDSTSSISDVSLIEEVGQISNEDGEISEQERKKDSEILQLRKWAIECKIPHAHLDKLLNIFRPRLLPNLPKSSKTCLRTSSAKYVITPMTDNDSSLGEFVYFSIKEGLMRCIDQKVHKKDTIYLQINIDSMPLFKSSAKIFWPILCRVHFNPMIYKPYPVAIYTGNSKPKVLSEFLQKFILEINELQADGLVIHEKHFQIKIHCFICDTPARSFLKCTQGHTGFSACERCDVLGKKINQVTVFEPQENLQERTDEFRNFHQPSHHMNASPLLLIYPPINMISQFVLDFMHLGPLGVMKRLLVENWTSGNLRGKISQQQKIELSRRLEYIGPSIPMEFQRKPRSLNILAKWKATEFMFILLYYGPIVLKHLISNE